MGCETGYYRRSGTIPLDYFRMLRDEAKRRLRDKSTDPGKTGKTALGLQSNGVATIPR